MSKSASPIPVTALVTLVVIIAFSGCSDGITGNRPDPGLDTACAITALESPTPVVVELQSVAEGVHRPTALGFAPGDSRYYITQQFDGVRIVEADGTVLPDMFVDLGGRLSNGIEQGVLGIAFAPDFQESGYFYLTYTDLEGDLHLARYEVGADPDRAEEHSILLTVPQPDPRHQGGHISFGPDGMLYVALGDGGTEFDQAGHGQNPGSLKGSILRIDVSGGGDYSIPPDNPFVGEPDARDEVWMYGLRNPWSVSFDEEGGCLYVADVGEVLREEVNAVRSDLSGLNFGWNRMEGSVCFQPDIPDAPGESCDERGLVLPIVDYSKPPCRSVIGGHVYRGTEIEGLEGAYLYADFCENWIRSLRLDNGLPVQQEEWSYPELEHPVHFGRGPDGELYVLTWDGGLFKLVAAG